MSKRVLILSSSPRKRGNSITLCNQFMEAQSKPITRLKRWYWQKRKSTTALHAMPAEAMGDAHRKMIWRRFSTA